MKKMKVNRNQIILVAVYGLFPLVCAAVYSILGGHWISDVYLPASYWNDELFYYKLVESVVNYGLPQGWFGFQEAHAGVFPFAAWSPVGLLPWVLWGVLFGWELTSPIYANIFYNMAAMAGFALLVKPSKKQSIFMLGLFAVFGQYSRYLLSGMPESIYIALGILLAGIAVSQNREDKTWKLAAMFAICSFVTMSRPYLILLMILPAWMLIKKKRKIGVLISILVAFGSALGYALFEKLCCAPYFIEIIETAWIRLFINEGFAAGMENLVNSVQDKLQQLIFTHLYRGVKYGLISGALFAVTGALAFLLFVWWIWNLKQKKGKEYRGFGLAHVVITVGMMVAIFLFYRIGEGSKHLLIFIALGLIWIALLDEKFYILKAAAALLCLYFFVIKAWAPYDWQVAYDDGRMKAEARDLGGQLDESMVLARTEDRFDNTVIWLASDIVDGESISAPWGYLYMIPEGFGINFCFQDYVMTNMDNLQAAYIAVLPGGDVEKALLERDVDLMGGTEHMRVYKLR